MKKILVMLTAGAVLAGCGETQFKSSRTAEANSSGGALAQEINEVQRNLRAASEGEPAGDSGTDTCGGLTDAQIIERVIARIHRAQENLRSSLDHAKANGVALPAELLEGAEKVAELAARLIEDLRNNAEARARVVEIERLICALPVCAMPPVPPPPPADMSVPPPAPACRPGDLF